MNAAGGYWVILMFLFRVCQWLSGAAYEFHDARRIRFMVSTPTLIIKGAARHDWRVKGLCSESRGRDKIARAPVRALS